MSSPAAPRRSGSRSRRSHPSFSDLRLAPLSTPAPIQQEKVDKSTMRISLDSPRTPGSIDPSTAHAYKVNHPSYLAGRSAPTTPGILSRSSSRKADADGLSRNVVYADDEDENIDPSTSYFDTPNYAAVRVNAQGGVDSNTGYMGDKGKSKSESGLNNAAAVRKARLRPLSTAGPLGLKSRTPNTASTPRGRSARPVAPSADDDWLSHATSFTTSLLQEGKAGAWVSSHSSVTNLHSYSNPKSHSAYPSSDSDDDTPNSHSSRPTHLPFSPAAHDASSPALRSPNLNHQTHGWSSRFGSRLPSAAHSRRNSRVHLRPLSGSTTPYPLSSTTDRPQTATSIDAILKPDFVDPRAQKEMETSLAELQRERAAAQQGDYFDSPSQAPYHRGRHADDGAGIDDGDDDEAEVARLAQTPGFGLGGFGIIDALVGLGGFGPGEEGGDTDGETTSGGIGRGRDDDGEREVGGEVGNKKRRSVMLDLQGWFGRQGTGDGRVGEGSGEGERERKGDEGEGGWSDAAWLLSVASKALLS
ncbi:hypothetical protein BDZ85DRAFT_318795 [Elsinoe ampelina]|uniref:Uncharacterized protein n=1 Tax=Elsinoe ampelina TaxID=302913 RepID=A0A6A6GCW1_9PEZI|nr:hypothetical protein BDZ85DRAFT_318795 [Elsinoe ampelina]